jgi:hypothetical protein
MAEMSKDSMYYKDASDFAIRYVALRMWMDLTAKLDKKPANKDTFLAAVYPEIKKALESQHERTEREGGLPASPVDNGSGVVGSVGPSVQKPACEWGGGVCR